MKNKPGTFYKALTGEIKRRAKTSEEDAFNLNQTIRRLREERKLSGVELCRRAGDLDPRTLTALEKGRIKNPSIKTLESVSKGLGLSVSDLFRQAEMSLERNFHLGSQKGVFQMDFPAWGVKIVSFTPLMKDFFCGKLILAPHRRLDQAFMNHRMPLHVSIVVGRVEVSLENRKYLLEEGENIFFNGILQHSFYNPRERDAVLLMVTAPSFL